LIGTVVTDSNYHGQQSVIEKSAGQRWEERRMKSEKIIKSFDIYIDVPRLVLALPSNTYNPKVSDRQAIIVCK